MTVRHRVLSTLLALTSLWAGGAAAEPLRVALNLAPMTAQVLVAQERGLFKRHGLDVSIVTFTQSLGAVESLLAGSADIALSAEAPINVVHAKGHRVALLASIEFSKLKTLSVEPAVRAAADLKGRRVGYVANSGSEQCAHGWRQRAGAAASEITLVPMLAQELPPAAAAGRIDAYCVWEPYVVQGRKAVPDKARVLEVPDPVTPTFYVVVGDDFAARKPAAAQAFLRALIEAEAWIAANRDDAITLVARMVGMGRPELAEIWGEYVFDVRLDARALEPLKRHAQWRLEQGKGPEGAKALPDFRRLFDNGPLLRVAPERVGM